MFVAEAFRRHFGNSLGYHEETILSEVLAIIAEHPSKPYLIVKKHPQNVDIDFDNCSLQKAQEKIPISMVGIEESPRPLAMIADIVVGMTSIFLVESIILGRITVSLQIGVKPEISQLSYPVIAGAIPQITRRVEAKNIIYRLLEDENFRMKWKTQQSTLKHRPGAAQRVLETIKECVA